MERLGMGQGKEASPAEKAAQGSVCREQGRSLE